MTITWIGLGIVIFELSDKIIYSRNIPIWTWELILFGKKGAEF